MIPRPSKPSRPGRPGRPDDLPLAFSAAAIGGVKAVEVTGPPDAPRVHPVGRFWRQPVEHRRVDTAVCRRSRGHVAPALDCRCGFHAVAHLDDLVAIVPVHPDTAVADVDLSGTVIEHERGVRAARQRILGLRFADACARCGDPAVAVATGGRWHPACDACRTRARARGVSVHTCAEVASRLGLEVRFATLPVESRRALLRWRLIAVAALVAAIACAVVLAVAVPAPLAAVAAGAGLAVLNGGFARRALTSRSSLTAATFAGYQSWTVTAAATMVTVTVLRARGHL